MRLYGLIGKNLGHSFSKQYFTSKFEASGSADCRFELFPLDVITQLPSLLQQEVNLRGLAVTIPYKKSVIPFLDALDDEAERIHAVNCIQICGGKLKGFNTDVMGFERTLVPLLTATHTHALVLGSGGASSAVQYVLSKLGILFLVASRQPKAARGSIGYDQLDQQIIHDYPLIINTTPLGMTPDTITFPDIPYHHLSSRNILYDLVYTPPLTRFLEQGLHFGATVKNGYDMLVVQAEENWRIWNES